MSEIEYGDISDKAKRMAWLLSLAGAMPFAGLAIILIFAPEGYSQFASALLTYGAIILSFLGGIRWGIALTRAEGRSATQVFALSVLPSLIGWAAVIFGGAGGFTLLAIAFFTQAVWDYGAWCTDVMQEWFVKIRMIVSAIVIVSLVIAAIATL